MCRLTQRYIGVPGEIVRRESDQREDGLCRAACQPNKSSRRKNRNSPWGYLATATLLVGLAAASPALAQVEDAGWTMYRDPELPTPELQILFSPRWVELWSQALEQPERDLRRRAASTIAMAHQRDLAGLEATIPRLMKMLEQPDQDRMVRLTVAQTLVALDARQSAALLLENLTAGDLDMAESVEPALARWLHAPARDMWLERLNSEITFRRSHILAIQGLTELGETKALPKLLEWALDRREPAGVRLAAAAGVGRLQKTGLEETVRGLIRDKSPTFLVDRLVAARMLVSHRGEETEHLLVELTTDPMPSVQAIALGQLFRIDPQLVMPLAERTLDSTDVNVRRIACEALIAVAQVPTPEKINTLSPLLDDPNPTLRRFVRESLTKLANDESLHDIVITAGRRVLGQDGWRGQEQAIQLLVALDDKTIVQRLLTLLDSQRPEAHTTAAWGLCQLNVPSSTERIYTVFEARTLGCLAAKPQTAGTEIQLSHLAQAIGRMKYAPADDLLRKYIPKDGMPDPTSRAAAIWALGQLHAGKPDDQLASQLSGRLTDVNSTNPEEPIVRRMSAVSLGRMKAIRTLGALRKMAALDGLGEATGIACAWAIQQTTGEPFPDVPPIMFRDNSWFLVPEITTLESEIPAVSEGSTPVE